MTKKLFNKLAFFTDIHLGYKSNDVKHNETCNEFIDWFIDQAKQRDCETCIFGGDWYHHRNQINLHTMHYGLIGLEKLSKAFDKLYFIIGNHDLYYKDNRSISSVEMAGLFPNIEVINNPTTIDNVTLLPWLVKDEWKKQKNISAKYIFGHLELPHFKMNSIVEKHDEGKLKASHFKKPDYVFSGHFHKRQKMNNIYYVGAPFPHNYADAWDDEKGMMFLEWDGEPEFINFPNGPKYRTLKMSQ